MNTLETLTQEDEASAMDTVMGETGRIQHESEFSRSTRSALIKLAELPVSIKARVQVSAKYTLTSGKFPDADNEFKDLDFLLADELFGGGVLRRFSAHILFRQTILKCPVLLQ